MPIKRIKLTDKYKVTVYNGGRKKSTVRRAAVKMEKTQGLEMETVENPSEPCHFLTDTQDSLNDQSVAMYSNGGKTEYEIRKNKIIENWNRVRQVLVDTHIEELSPSSNECCMCKTVVEEIIYCDDCGPTAYYCQACCQRIHAVVVFHTPQIWKGSLYVPLPMLATFQRVDNHDCGTLYTSSIYAINGKGVQHECTITLCKCEEPAVTLMRYRLWPATPQKPRIAFDLRFMEILSALQLECHMSAKSFCDAMESIQTDFIHISHDFPKNIYRAVVGDCLTEFNYHRSSIRTRHAVCENTFARECPICKQNPQIISLDANFGLVRKSSSGEGHGRTGSRHKNVFFKEHSQFQEFIENYSKDKKVKNEHCSNFQAGSVIRSKITNAKLDITGLFGSVCKHDAPIHFIDMMHGERLGYAVYILLQTMNKKPHIDEDKKVIVMYDIACSLHKHLQINKKDELLEMFSFVVPVFHSFAHNMHCQLTYGQRYVSGTGLTDGEGIERFWSYLRNFKKITKEMTVDSRCDLLTEAMLYHVYKMVWSLGGRLYTRLTKAKAIIAESSNLINTITLSLNADADQAKVWLDEWKTQSQISKVSGLTLSVNEAWMEYVFKIGKKRELLIHSSTNSEKDLIETDISNLKVQMNKIEKKVDEELKAMSSSFNFNEEPQKTVLFNGMTKRRRCSLKKLKQLATERQYLSTMMKKYADGQILGTRISKQFGGNTIKIKRELDVLNDLEFFEKVDFSKVSTPLSPIFEELETLRLDHNQQRAAQAYSLHLHSLEEYETIKQEIKLMQLFLLEEKRILEESLFSCLQVQNKYNVGKRHYLCHQLFKIEQIWENCMAAFNEINIGDIDFKCSIHEIIGSNLQQLHVHSLETAPISEEELSEILKDVHELENQDEDVDDDNLDDIDD